MMWLPSLVLRAAMGWVTDKVLPLPVAASAAAWAVLLDDELRVWINGPGAGRSEQLRVLKTHRMERLPSLPLAVAGVARCDGELTVSGADAAGQPRVAGVAADGAIVWQHAVPGPTPSRWPVPGCAPEPVIAWQTTPRSVELARVGADGIGARHAVPVGGPLLELAPVPGAIWAAWAEVPGIRGKEITTQRVRDFHVATPRPDSFAIGAGSGGARLAWTQDGLCFLAPLVPGVTAAGSAVALDLADAAGGSLAVVSGPETIVWAQRANTMEGAPPRWTSVLIVPRSGRIEVDGLVHAVTWWGEAVAVIGAMELLVLKRTG